MIRRVFSLDKNLLQDCFYIANQFMDATSLIAWAELKGFVVLGTSVLFVDEKENGYLKGFLLGSIKQNSAVVDNLFVDRPFQRAGVGGALMDAYEDFARRCGAKQIKLQSRPTKQAVEFYKKRGFMKTNLAYHMQKSL
jgi:GNAT superfamily N-acetyltransferase